MAEAGLRTLTELQSGGGRRRSKRVTVTPLYAGMPSKRSRECDMPVSICFILPLSLLCFGILSLFLDLYHPPLSSMSPACRLARRSIVLVSCRISVSLSIGIALFSLCVVK